MNGKRRAGVLVVFLAAGLAGASGIGPMLTIAVDDLDNVDAEVAYSPPHDAFLAVWATRQGPNSADIWARAVSPAGDLFPIFNVEARAGVSYADPAVAYGSAQDEYLVVFVEFQVSGASMLWARRVRWNGPGTGPPFLIADATSSPSPAVAYNSTDDEFVVVYEVGVGNLEEIRAVRVDAETGLTSPPETISPSGERWNPDVAYDPVNNRYLVVYQQRPETGPAKFLLRLVSADLQFTSAESLIGEDNSVNVSRYPRVTVHPGGGLVTWHHWGTITSSVKVRRVGLNGTPLGPADGLLVLEGTSQLVKIYPDICIDYAGRALVTWESFDFSKGAANIQGRYVSVNSDSTLGDRFGIDTRAGDQSRPAVGCSGTGNALVVLSDVPNPTPNDDDVIGYIVSSVVFADGFEPGDCRSWSSAVGETN